MLTRIVTIDPLDISHIANKQALYELMCLNLAVTLPGRQSAEQYIKPTYMGICVLKMCFPTDTHYYEHILKCIPVNDVFRPPTHVEAIKTSEDLIINLTDEELKNLNDGPELNLLGNYLTDNYLVEILRIVCNMLPFWEIEENKIVSQDMAKICMLVNLHMMNFNRISCENKDRLIMQPLPLGFTLYRHILREEEKIKP